MTIPNALLDSIKQDRQQVLDYFNGRWNKKGQTNVIGLEGVIRQNFIGALVHDARDIRGKLDTEIHEDLEFISYVQSYDIQSLTLKVIEEDLDNFTDYWTDPSTPLDSCEINNGLIDLGPDDYMEGIDMPASILNELIEDRIKTYLFAEVYSSSILDIYLSGLKLRDFYCSDLKSFSSVNHEVLPSLFYELFDYSVHSNKANWQGDTLCDDLCTGTEYKNIQIDGLYLIIFYFIDRLTLTKPANITLDYWLLIALEIKNCFSYILQLQTASFQSLQETLSQIKAEQLKINNTLNTYVNGTQKGRNNKHKFSHQYRPLIESAVEVIFNEIPTIRPTAIFNDSRVKAIIQQCTDAQKMDAVKPFEHDAFITWIKQKLRDLKKPTLPSSTTTHP